MLGFRLFFIGILASAVIGAGVYVMKLRSDNAILKANAIKLESAVAEQQELITQQKEDFKEIMAANKKMNELVGNLKKDLEDLDKRFNKKNRDFGKLAIEKTKAIANSLYKLSKKGDIFALYGDIGVGKTTFVRYFISNVTKTN